MTHHEHPSHSSTLVTGGMTCPFFSPVPPYQLKKKKTCTRHRCCGWGSRSTTGLQNTVDYSKKNHHFCHFFTLVENPTERECPTPQCGAAAAVASTATPLDKPLPVGNRGGTQRPPAGGLTTQKGGIENASLLPFGDQARANVARP